MIENDALWRFAMHLGWIRKPPFNASNKINKMKRAQYSTKPFNPQFDDKHPADKRPCYMQNNFKKKTCIKKLKNQKKNRFFLYGP